MIRIASGLKARRSALSWRYSVMFGATIVRFCKTMMSSLPSSCVSGYFASASGSDDVGFKRESALRRQRMSESMAFHRAFGPLDDAVSIPGAMKSSEWLVRKRTHDLDNSFCNCQCQSHNLDRRIRPHLLREQADELGYRAFALTPDHVVTIPQLTRFMRSRRHELHLDSRKVLSRPPDNGSKPVRAADVDRADNGGYDAQRSHGEDDAVGPAHRLAEELHCYALAEEGLEAGRILSAGGYFLDDFDELTEQGRKEIVGEVVSRVGEDVPCKTQESNGRHVWTPRHHGVLCQRL